VLTFVKNKGHIVYIYLILIHVLSYTVMRMSIIFPPLIYNVPIEAQITVLLHGLRLAEKSARKTVRFNHGFTL
jgi:hypothetical protein